MNVATSAQGKELIVVGTLGGSVRVFVPLLSRKTLKILRDVETEMRRSYMNLISRDHFSFRSSYLPCQAVIDGELCDRFAELSQEEKSHVATNLGLRQEDICRVLDEIRNQIV